MNTGILTITSTNKREKNFNFHSNTSRACLYMEKKKIEKSETLSLPHGHIVVAVLQNRKTSFLQTYTGDSLSLSLSLSPLRR